MANPEHVAILKQGVEAWNAWRTEMLKDEESFKVPDLSHADFRNAELSCVDLNGTYLERARFDGADLSDANLQLAMFLHANLIGANLRRASLVDAHLNFAHLRHADLGGAELINTMLDRTDLRGASLRGVQLRGGDLSGARLGGTTIVFTTFADIDMQTVLGLDTVEHDGPSTIGVDTLLRSEGHIPDAFLRGCGVNPLIQRLLVGDRASMTDAFYEWVNEGSGPLCLQSCFISYSTRDKPFVDRLQKSLNASGVNYWYAPEHGRWGKELTSQIDREIENRDRVILVCSEHSLASDWVRWEIDRTREREKARGKTILYPIMLDDAVLSWNDPRASRIREILVGDFRGATKGKAFEERFGRLLEGLRDEG